MKKTVENIEISIDMMHVLIMYIVKFIGMKIGFVSLHKVFKMTTILFNAESKHLQTWAGKLAASCKMHNYSKIDWHTWRKVSDYKISASKEHIHIIDTN